jgi:hypothetical protein
MHKTTIAKLKILAVFLILAFPSLAQAQYSDSGNNSLGINNLMSAVIDGDVKGVAFFSKIGGAAINETNIAGSTALNLAARKGNFEIIEILVTAGANVNIADNEGWTPLMRSALAGNDKAVALLLEKNADVTKVNSIHQSAVVHASIASCLKCLDDIFKKFDLNNQDNVNFLKTELTESFTISRNREDETLEKAISSYIDQLTKKPEEEKVIATSVVITAGTEQKQNFKVREGEQGTLPKPVDIISSTYQQPKKRYVLKPAEGLEYKFDQSFTVTESQAISAVKDDFTEERKSDDEIIFKFNSGVEGKAPKKAIKPKKKAVQKVAEVPVVKVQEIKKVEEVKPVEKKTEVPVIAPKAVEKPKPIEAPKQPEVKPTVAPKENSKVEDLKKSEIKSTTLIREEPKPAPAKVEDNKTQPKFVIGVMK